MAAASDSVYKSQNGGYLDFVTDSRDNTYIRFYDPFSSGQAYPKNSEGEPLNIALLYSPTWPSLSDGELATPLDNPYPCAVPRHT